jgi:hypothetical protein
MKTKSSRAVKAKAGKAKKKRKPDTAVPPDESEIASLNPLRRGMPALDSITDVKEFRKGKKVYRIIKTNEVDEYETPPKKKP